VQGFIFSDPVPADQVKLMLQQNPFRAMVLDEQPEAATAV
jgi:hypothetical protein